VRIAKESGQSERQRHHVPDEGEREFERVKAKVDEGCDGRGNALLDHPLECGAGPLTIAIDTAEGRRFLRLELADGDRVSVAGQVRNGPAPSCRRKGDKSEPDE
jgi:hypothetical protein